MDVGIGTPPDATVELHRSLRERWPDVRTLGVDVVRHYVDDLLARQIEGVEARLGGEVLPLRPQERPVVVRAINLLRGARERDVTEGLQALAAPLARGGWLLEGSTDTEGDVGVYRVLRATMGRLEEVALIMTTTFQRGFDPRLFTAWLPKGLGRHARPGPAVEERFERWVDATRAARAAGVREPLDTFMAAASRLAEVDEAVVRSSEEWQGGVLWWRAGSSSPRRVRL
ncbi:MAG: hypothetical protein EA397_10085 [Deltaproteobacteria bacterium]|nr:MAG: hypothetical protein EA397_10085 [Deltaproteobacteria bacterium]